MKHSKLILIIALLSVSGFELQAQINAVTGNGDEVVLYDNGTWKYVNELIDENRVIPTNDKNFIKGKKSSFLVKSNKINIGVYLNPKSWSFSKAGGNDAAEFEFQKKDEDLYAMLITEKLEIPIATLRDVALENARSAAPDIKLIKEEFRNVNGMKVLMMQMAGTIQEMKFTYFGYYFSNSNGTIQLLAYTGDNLFSSYESDIEEFLNGLTEIQE